MNKLTSVHTQLPYDFYSLPFCQPPNGISEFAENLGEILTGDIIQNSAYKVMMKIKTSCQLLCRKLYTPEELSQFSDKIDKDYMVNWWVYDILILPYTCYFTCLPCCLPIRIVDNLPAATTYYMEEELDENMNPSGEPHYEKGFAVGFVGVEDVCFLLFGFLFSSSIFF